MYLASDEFLAAITGDHDMVETVEVLGAGDEVLTTLDVVAGSVTEDGAAIVRHSADITVVDPTGDLTPTDLDDMLMPIGTRLRVSRGLLVNGEAETYPLATAWLTRSRARLDPDGRATIPLVGYDRSSRLQRPTARPLVVASGQPYPTAIYNMLSTLDGGLDAELMASEWTTPSLVYEAETDLLDEAVEMATAIGAEVFVNREDRLVVRPIPLRADNYVWTFEEGDRSTVLDSEVVWETDGRPNGVIVIGQHSSMPSPVRGEAWDMDPSSPTFRYGALGENPRFVRTEKATTIPQAQAMAAALLQDLGGAQEVDLTIYPPPVHLLCGDPVRLDLPSIGVDGTFLISAMSTELADPSAPAEITVRARIETTTP